MHNIEIGIEGEFLVVTMWEYASRIDPNSPPYRVGEIKAKLPLSELAYALRRYEGPRTA